MARNPSARSKSVEIDCECGLIATVSKRTANQHVAACPNYAVVTETVVSIYKSVPPPPEPKPPIFCQAMTGESCCTERYGHPPPHRCAHRGLTWSD